MSAVTNQTSNVPTVFPTQELRTPMEGALIIQADALPARPQKALIHINRLEIATRIFSITSIAGTGTSLLSVGLGVVRVIPLQSSLVCVGGTVVLMFTAMALASVQQTLGNKHHINLRGAQPGAWHRLFVESLSVVSESIRLTSTRDGLYSSEEESAHSSDAEEVEVNALIQGTSGKEEV